MITALAMFGQIIVPVAFGIGAIVSMVQAAKGRKLYEGDLPTLYQLRRPPKALDLDQGPAHPVERNWC